MKMAKDYKTPELGTRQSFLSTFSIATDHASKLGLGRNQTIISAFSNYQVLINLISLKIYFLNISNFR